VGVEKGQKHRVLLGPPFAPGFFEPVGERRGCPYDPRGKVRPIREPNSRIGNRRSFAATFEINGRGLCLRWIEAV
jgi:hypothetical protein